MPPSKKSGDPRSRAAAIRAEQEAEQDSQLYSPKDEKYAPTSWGGSAYEDVPLPSGQLCLARKVGVQGLLESGIIHDIDPLMGFIQQHQNRMEGKDTLDENAAMMDVLKDESKRVALFHMLDKIVCYVVVKPHVEMTPNDITRRKPDVIYADMVDMMDKMHIMTWTLGGVEKLSSFPKQFEEHMGSLSTEQEHGDKAE